MLKSFHFDIHLYVWDTKFKYFRPSCGSEFIDLTKLIYAMQCVLRKIYMFCPLEHYRKSANQRRHHDTSSYTWRRMTLHYEAIDLFSTLITMAFYTCYRLEKSRAKNTLGKLENIVAEICFISIYLYVS